MTGTIKSITALVALVSLALSGSLEAAELDTTLRALPMHAVTFDIGSKHAISYFLIKDGNCDLTVWLTDISLDDEATPSMATRMVLAVAPGKTMRVGSAEGMAAEFACAANAESMSVRNPDRGRLLQAATLSRGRAMRVFLRSARKLLFAFLKHSKPSLSGQAALLSHQNGGSMVRTLFAFPYDLRMLALSNIDQARVAYTQVMDAATQR